MIASILPGFSEARRDEAEPVLAQCIGNGKQAIAGHGEEQKTGLTLVLSRILAAHRERIGKSAPGIRETHAMVGEVGGFGAVPFKIAILHGEYGLPVVLGFVERFREAVYL